MVYTHHEKGGIIPLKIPFHQTIRVIHKRALAVSLCLAVCAGISGCQNSDDITVERGTLRVGVRDFVPGFGYKNPDSGVYSGLEIDIAKAIAKETGRSLELIPVDNAQRTKLLDDGAVDCIIATFSETDERKETYDFSVSYYTDYVRILSENSSKIKTLSDLKGLTIGVVQNSTTAKALVDEMVKSGYIPKTDMAKFDVETFQDGLSFKIYEDYAALAYGLETGAVDAAAGDGSLLMGYKNSDRSFLPDKLAEQHYGVCMIKDAPLKDEIDASINRMLHDGTIEKYIVNHGLKE